MIKALIIFAFLALTGFFAYQFINQNELFFTSSRIPADKILAERIPGSKFHSPDATWWGYNQIKIVRFGDTVYTYVIENSDESNKTISNFVIYAKTGDGEWKKGASLPTSRPGNILVDSQGILHAFVFEPNDVSVNDSLGKLIHYRFPVLGDIKNFEKEIVIDNDGENESVNIRIGAAIGEDDTMAIGFGLTDGNKPYNGHSEHLYTKKPAESEWTHHIAGENLGHDWYYPFVLSTKKGFHMLSVQDDYVENDDPNIYSNVYQKIMYFEYKDKNWNQRIITDLTSHPLASSRLRLLEQEELFEDKAGNIHILYKEYPDRFFEWKTAHKHTVIKNGSLETKNLDFEKDGIGWVRLFEVEGELYYLVVSWDRAHIGKPGSSKLIELDIPSEAKGTYPYVSTKKGGTKTSEKFIDIILLAADSKTYEEGKNANLYIRIPKEEIVKLKFRD